MAEIHMLPKARRIVPELEARTSRAESGMISLFLSQALGPHMEFVLMRALCYQRRFLVSSARSGTVENTRLKKHHRSSNPPPPK